MNSYETAFQQAELQAACHIVRNGTDLRTAERAVERWHDAGRTGGHDVFDVSGVGNALNVRTKPTRAVDSMAASAVLFEDDLTRVWRRSCSRG